MALWPALRSIIFNNTIWKKNRLLCDWKYTSKSWTFSDTKILSDFTGIPALENSWSNFGQDTKEREQRGKRAMDQGMFLICEHLRREISPILNILPSTGGSFHKESFDNKLIVSSFFAKYRTEEGRHVKSWQSWIVNMHIWKLVSPNALSPSDQSSSGVMRTPQFLNAILYKVELTWMDLRDDREVMDGQFLHTRTVRLGNCDTVLSRDERFGQFVNVQCCTLISTWPKFAGSCVKPQSIKLR